MIYLDNAATSFPKPRAVRDEVMLCLSEYCGNAGRGAHALALTSAEIIYDCRRAICELFDAPGPQNVIFTSGATMALNIAINGLGNLGGHVICSNLEHNSVRRPLLELSSLGRISFSLFNAYNVTQEKMLSEIRSQIRRDTVAVICTAAPNTVSSHIPIARIGELCRQCGLLFIVDGAQAAGHIELTLEGSHIDALCVPGHKGLLGPQGVGALILSDRFSPSPILFGGSGSTSTSPKMPTEMPERLEAGTLPTPSIAGLLRGVEAVGALGVGEIYKHSCVLFAKCAKMLERIPGCRIYQPQSCGSVLSFNLEGMSSEAVAQMLSERGICVRGGLHCAPWAHRAMGTLDGGTVRTSFSYFNSEDDVIALASALSEIAIKK